MFGVLVFVSDVVLFMALVCLIPNNLVLLAQVNTWVGNVIANFLAYLFSFGGMAKFAISTSLKATANYYGFTVVYITLKLIKDLSLRGLRPSRPKPSKEVKTK
jgi:hypothetical protein